MKLRKLIGLAPAAMMTLGLAACGGGSNIDKVKEDFNSPSGSVNDQQAVAGVAGKRDSSSSALGIVGGGVPGSSLTAYGKKSALEKLSPMSLFGRWMLTLNDQILPNGVRSNALRTAQEMSGDGECSNSAEATAAWEQLQSDIQSQAGSSSIEASTSYSIDVGACAGDSTGKINVEFTIKAEQSGNGAKIEYDITMDMVDVCETSGDQTCVNGTLEQQAVIESGGDGNGQLQSVTAYDLTAKDASGKSVKAKGGYRIGFSSNGDLSNTQVEYLFYAKSSTGEEVSFVLTYSVNSDGSTALSYRGSDGELTCTQDAMGNGSCTGTGSNGAIDLSWTDAEADEYAELDAG